VHIARASSTTFCVELCTEFHKKSTPNFDAASQAEGQTDVLYFITSSRMFNIRSYASLLPRIIKARCLAEHKQTLPGIKFLF
jgi:hypothetical protein